MKYNWDQFFPGVSLDYFFSSIMGEKIVHSVVDFTEVASIVTWYDINQILSCGMLQFPRVRVTKNGSIVPESDYCFEEVRRRERTLYAEPSKLYQLMSNGAVLVLDSIHELSPKIAFLAGFFSTVLHETIQINCYIGGVNSAGFDLHWDDHDVFILQIHGAKQWEIRKHTRKYPMFKDIEPNLEPPADIEWQGTLNAGEILYIPKGWWHKAFSSTDLTCHLTLGAPQRTGIDYLTHIVDLCKQSEFLRKSLPKPPLDSNSDIDQRTKLIDLCAQVISQVSISDFWHHHQAMMRTRYSYSFPYSLGSYSISQDSIVALSFLHRPTLETAPHVRFGVFENVWTFDKSTSKFFELLWLGQNGVKVSILVDSLNVSYSESIQLIDDLISNGLLVIIFDHPA